MVFPPRSTIVVSAFVLLTGCQLTPVAQTKKRIQEKSEAYSRLTLTQQADVMGGAIQRGNTADMVYLALGKPKKIVTSADGVKAMWVYEEFYATNSYIASQVNSPSGAGGESNGNGYVTGLVGANGGRGGPSRSTQEIGSQGTGSRPVASQFLIPAELKSKTVYVFFFRGRVAEIKLDGDASDQDPKYNKLPVAKKTKENPFPRSMVGDIDAARP